MSIRNIAIIAHVDHGKTTLVDQLFRQSGTLRTGELLQERAMDSDDQERERGITITAKCTSIRYEGHTINIIDTPGHADFGGEVERVLNMAEGALLLVDAVEGTMPQTRFVLSKALAQNLKPIVVINKVDRPAARPDESVEMVFDLFVELGANDEQCDFKVLYCSALDGRASLHDTKGGTDLKPLFETILAVVPPPVVGEGPARMLVSNLGYDDYLGRLSIGRLHSGVLHPGDEVKIFTKQGLSRGFRLTRLMKRIGMKYQEIPELLAGDIATVAGAGEAMVGDTLAAPDVTEPLPRIEVDPPTLSMEFCVNDSPFAGREGKYVTTRHLRDRLFKEAEHNVSLRVEETDSPDRYKVSGRGELHLAVLIENMRREGYELQVSQPEVILRTDEAKRLLEPMEKSLIDVPALLSGTVIDSLNRRKGEMLSMNPTGDRIRLEYLIPSRGLLGYRSQFLTETRGEGILNSEFAGYGPHKGEIARRTRGSMIASETGDAVPFALFNLQARGSFFIGPGTKCYAGMVVGENARENDLEINVAKEKKLTNMRSAGAEEAVRLTPPRKITIESCLEFLSQDELLEVTPQSLRLRKRFLNDSDRRRAVVKKRAEVVG